MSVFLAKSLLYPSFPSQAWAQQAKQEPSMVFLIPQGITQEQVIPTSDASLVVQAIERKPTADWIVETLI